MKRLSDYKGEEAFEVLADIMEPLAVILADEEILPLARSKAPAIKYVKPILKNHKEELMSVLARLDGTPIEEYKESVNLITLPAQIMTFINDPQVRSLFTLQNQRTESSSSGPALEGTKE